MSDTKRCLGCCRWYPASDYSKAGRGVSRFCDDCRERGLTDDQRRSSRRVAGVEYRWRNIEQVRERDRQYQRRKAA